MFLFAWMVHCVAQPVQAIERDESIKWSYQLGVDSWRIRTSVNKDTDPGYISESTNLLLPNAYTKWKFSETSPYGWVIGQKAITSDTTTSLKARAEQTLGLRIDEAQVQTNFSPFLGLRYGVVDYKTSWCRNYESDNVWIREIEMICSTPQFRDVTGGSPGIQLFTNKQWGDYLVQSQIGIYRPLQLKYAPREFGNLLPSPNYSVQTNNKVGINLNLIDLLSALEMRVSYIRGYQKAYLPEQELLGNFQQTSDMVYVGLSYPLTERLTGRITHLQQRQYASCRSAVAKFAEACNLNLIFDKNASALELSYRLNASDLVAVGTNRTVFEIDQDLFNPLYDVYSADLTRLRVNQKTMAWRRDWGQGVFSVMQFIQSRQMSSERALAVGSHGSALGVRVGYQY